MFQSAQTGGWLETWKRGCTLPGKAFPWVLPVQEVEAGHEDHVTSVTAEHDTSKLPDRWGHRTREVMGRSEITDSKRYGPEVTPD